MDEKISAFIEQMELFGHDTGMPRSFARVIGFLLVCEPARQSAKDIQEALSLSTGAVSNTLAALRASGMVRPVSTPGVRSMLYEMDSTGWKRNAARRIKASTRALEIAEQGLQLQPDLHAAAARHRRAG